MLFVIFKLSRIIKPKARNGRTYTMLEQEEQILRQQLMERDLRLQESERRQEVSASEGWLCNIKNELNVRRWRSR